MKLKEGFVYLQIAGEHVVLPIDRKEAVKDVVEFLPLLSEHKVFFMSEKAL